MQIIQPCAQRENGINEIATNTVIAEEDYSTNNNDDNISELSDFEHIFR